MPAVTLLAVGRQLMLVTVQAGEGAEVDHGVRVLRWEAHGTSQPHGASVRISPDAPTPWQAYAWTA